MKTKTEISLQKTLKPNGFESPYFYKLILVRFIIFEMLLNFHITCRIAHKLKILMSCHVMSQRVHDPCSEALQSCDADFSSPNITQLSFSPNITFRVNATRSYLTCNIEFSVDLKTTNKNTQLL